MDENTKAEPEQKSGPVVSLQRSGSPSVAILATLLAFAEAVDGMSPKAVMVVAMGVIDEMQRLRDEAIDASKHEAPPNDRGERPERITPDAHEKGKL